jgi:serine/threonine-protein kinase
MMAQADNHFAAGQAPKAIEAMQAARQINAQALSGLPAGDPARLPVLRQQFNLNHRVAGLSLRQSGQAYAQGLALAQANLPLAEELSQALAQTRPPGADKANPALQASQVHLRDANDFLSNRLLASGQAQNALAPMQTALSLSRAAHAAEPTGANAVYVMVSLSQRAEIHLHLNQLVQAEADALQALALARQTHLADPQNALFKARYANIGRRTGALLNQIGSPAAHSLAQSLLAQVANVSASFTPQDGVFWHQHQLVVVQQAQAALALGQVQTAQRLLAMFASQGADNPRAALDLTDAYLLRAKAAAAAGQAEDSKAALALALAPLQARAQSTPADVMTRANLADACQWALNQSAFSADHAQHRACVQAQVRDLAQAQQLTPWWRKRLAAFLPA